MKMLKCLQKNRIVFDNWNDNSILIWYSVCTWYNCNKNALFPQNAVLTYLWHFGWHDRWLTFVRLGICWILFLVVLKYKKWTSGVAELAEVDGPYVKISLKGRFWHERSLILARLGNYLKQRIPVKVMYLTKPSITHRLLFNIYWVFFCRKSWR